MYNVASKNGWLKECNWVGIKRVPSKYSLEEFLELAKGFTFSSDFSREYPRLYSAAQRNGWLKNYKWAGKKQSKKPTNTREVRFNTAKQFKYSADFRKSYPNLYITARTQGWLTDYTWFEKKPSTLKYTKEYCFEIALKYKHSSDFSRENPNVYNSACKYGWIKDYTWFERKPAKLKYSKEEVRNSALKYKTVADFCKHDRKLWSCAKSHGWLVEFDWLQKVRVDPGYWDVYENNRNEALKYKTRTEFEQNNGAAYKAACKNKFIGLYDWFERNRVDPGYWNNYNTNKAEALKYSTRTDFYKNSSVAYDYARLNGWLDTYDWFDTLRFTKDFVLKQLKSGDLDGMSRQQMIELIMHSKLSPALKVLVYTRPNSERSREAIRNLIRLYESKNTDAENQTAIENMEQEERKENERETRREVADNGLLSLIVQSPVTEPDHTDESGTQVTYTLPTVVTSQFRVNDETIKVDPTDKASKFLIEEDNAKLWNAMLYANEDGLADAEFEKIKAMECGNFSGYVRDMFVSEYEAVTSIKEDEDYRFYIDGKFCRPLLMQKLMAYKMSTHDCYGNWCGTGAGKTNAFLFSTRYVKAKTSVVITPNGVVDTMVKAIKRIYPNSNIVVPKTPDDIMPYSKDQYTYIILNYEKFQEHKRAKEYINRLLETNTIDFVCLDEVQNIKVRNVKTASNRSKYIGTLLVKAREQRPGMKTLVMTATPCPNCLSEVRSIIEMLTGKRYKEIGNRSDSVNNVHNAYKALILNGFRYVPKYPIVLNERTVEIDCTGDDELYLKLSDKNIDINDIEYILAQKKLEVLRNEIKDGTIVYSNWVDCMAGMLEENIRSWGYSVECYNGRCGGKEERAEIMEQFLQKKINVLVCSQPITTGVNDLQQRSDKLVYMSLPWTYDDKIQTDGRLYRQGSAFKSIDVVIPQVTITMPNGEIWSWDKGRLGAIENKRSLSSAVLDGYLQDSYRLSREHLKKLALEALRKGFDEPETEREEIDIEIDLEETEEQRRTRRENYVSVVHRLGNSSNHKTMHRYFKEHPDVFNTYHDSRDTDELAEYTIKPIADFINSKYHDKKIADLGCGVNMLSTLVKNGNKVTGFDHQQYKDHSEVVVADIGDLSGIVGDGEMDIAVFSLSLWGQDYEDYFNEAYRILDKNGVVFVAEPASKFGENEKFGTEEDFIDMVENYGFFRLGPIEKHRSEHGVFEIFKFKKE